MNDQIKNILKGGVAVGTMLILTACGDHTQSQPYGPAPYGTQQQVQQAPPQQVIQQAPPQTIVVQQPSQSGSNTGEMIAAGAVGYMLGKSGSQGSPSGPSYNNSYHPPAQTVVNKTVIVHNYQTPPAPKPAMTYTQQPAPSYAKNTSRPSFKGMK